MSWDKREIAEHAVAAKLLTETKDRVWDYIRTHPRATEYEIETFIRQEFGNRGLVALKPYTTQIVGFDAHAAIPHYFPKRAESSKLKANTLILLDTWGKLRNPRSPFADITWIAYYGRKVPKEIQKVFDAVLRARDACLAHLKSSLRKGRIPTGAEMDAAAHERIVRAGYEKHILHRTGHCLGFTSPHGKGVNLSPRFRRPLQKNVGYTIEPGIYLKGKFGIRSEINFYINNKNGVVVTTPMQRKIVVL